MTVVVIGGGITGLAAARALGQAGVPVLLLEASHRLGGKIRTERSDGFVIDHGPDSFITIKPGVVRLARALGLSGSIVRPLEPRTVLISTGGKLRRLPEGMGLALPTRLRPFLATDLFAPWDKLRMALDLVLPRDRRTGDLPVGAFLGRRLGRALVDRLAGPLIGGVYGTPIDELSLDAVVPSLRAAERAHRSLLLASLAEGRTPGGRTPGRRTGGRTGEDSAGTAPFMAMAGGMAQLSDALAAALASLPTIEIRLGVRAVHLEGDGTTVVVRLADGELVRAEGVIVAPEGPAAADLLADVAPDASRAIRGIRHSTSTVVTLAYRDEQVPEHVRGPGFLVANDEPLAIGAVTLTSRKWPGRAPPGHLLARAFVRSGPATTADGSAPGDDAALIALAHRDVAATLGVRGDPLLTRIARYPQLMPQYTVGHLERVAAIEAALAARPMIQVAGAPYRGAGMPDCIAQGEAAAARLLALLANGSPREALLPAVSHVR